MKRTTVASFVGAFLTIAFIIGYIIFHSNVHNTNMIEAANNLITVKDSMKLPDNVKHVHVEHIKGGNKAAGHLLSNIELIPSEDGNNVYASSQVLEHIKTEVDGDTLILKLDLRDHKFRTSNWRTAEQNRNKKPLLTVAIDHDVVSVSSNKAGFKQPIYYLLKGFKLPQFTVRMNNSHVVLAECTFGQLEVSCAFSMDLKHVQAKILAVMDNPEDDNMHLKSHDSKVDTIDAKVHNRIYVTNTKEVNHIRWEPLDDDATIRVILSKGQTLEEVQTSK